MLQIVQGVIDLLAAVLFRDQTLDVDAAVLRHLQHLHHVGRAPARDAFDGNFFGHEIPAADRKRGAPQPSDNRCGAARSGRLNNLIGGFRVADCFECFIDAAVGKLFHQRDRIFGLGIERVGRAELLGLFELLVDDIHGDDRISPEAFEKLNRIESDPAAADDQRGIAGRQFSHVLDRVIRRRYPATDYARLLQAYAVGNFERHITRDGDVFGKTADVPPVDSRTVGFLERRRRRPIGAEVFARCEAVAAAPALVAHADDDAVPFVKKSRQRDPTRSIVPETS